MGKGCGDQKVEVIATVLGDFAPRPPDMNCAEHEPRSTRYTEDGFFGDTEIWDFFQYARVDFGLILRLSGNSDGSGGSGRIF